MYHSCRVVVMLSLSINKTVYILNTGRAVSVFIRLDEVYYGVCTGCRAVSVLGVSMGALVLAEGSHL